MKAKQILNLAGNELVYGGHLLSLGASSIVFTSAVLLDIKITWDCLAVVYLGAQIIYLYNRYKEFRKDFLTNPERTNHLRKYIKIVPLLIFIFTLIFIAILLNFNKFPALIFGLILILLGLLYSKCFKSFSKKIIGFKNLFVPFIWGLSVIFLVIYYSFVSLNFSVFFIFIFIYLRLYLHEIFFDIKDIKSDKKESLLTLPIIFEKQKLFDILNLVNVLAAIPIIIGFCLGLLPKFAIILLLMVIYAFYYLRKFKKEAYSVYLHNLIIDGEYILWSLFVLLGYFYLN